MSHRSFHRWGLPSHATSRPSSGDEDEEPGPAVAQERSQVLERSQTTLRKDTYYENIYIWFLCDPHASLWSHFPPWDIGALATSFLNSMPHMCGYRCVRPASGVSDLAKRALWRALPSFASSGSETPQVCQLRNALDNIYQDPPTSCLETLTGGFWVLVCN